MPTKVVFCKEAELRLAITILRESAERKLAESRLPENQHIIVEETGATASAELQDIAQKQLAAARELEWSLEGLSSVLTADEEKMACQRELDKLWQDVGHKVHGTLSEQLACAAEYLHRQRQEAFGVAGTLVDDQRVRLEAMRWVLRSALDSPTHKSKDQRLRLALESIEQIIGELQNIDPDTIDRYTGWRWETGSWNTRRLNADLRHKDSQIQQMRERIAALEAKPGTTQEAEA